MRIGKYIPFYSENELHLYWCGDRIIVWDGKSMYFGDAYEVKMIHLHVEEGIFFPAECERIPPNEQKIWLAEWTSELANIEIPTQHEFDNIDCLYQFKHSVVEGNRLRFVSQNDLIRDLISLGNGVVLSILRFGETWGGPGGRLEIVAWELCK